MGTRVHPWRMHVDVWKNQYNIVKERKRKQWQKKKQKKKKVKAVIFLIHKTLFQIKKRKQFNKNKGNHMDKQITRISTMGSQ